MIGLLVGILTVLSAGAQQDTLKYRICLKDKAATEYSLQRRRLWSAATARDWRWTLPTCLCVEAMWTRYGGRE